MERNFFTISQILKKNLIYFGHKIVETGPSCSHKLASFLNYHMPLKKKIESELKLQKASCTAKNANSIIAFKYARHSCLI